ncbi:hypothetical protein FIBSPDRAFT_896154 [Athelia psychrophila]|uniref:Uncharacterized protein n=1 Tax=Athelia psychrophila TaxID=1759441 RepID=A0A166DPE0_9AGAM|nr:hypothetical protein FIBSPDRAFT_896154 [Fibularhizoctonia sp. CBS 109695]
MMLFAQSVGRLWAPLLYCLGVTVMEVTFCLGMIWQMNPYLMPKAFCITQIAVFGFCSFFITGVIATFTYATACTVFRATSKNQITDSTLSYRHGYIIPILVLPLIASAGQMTAVIMLDAAQPTNDMHCDASPIWIRFLGYAGLPAVAAIPCFLLASVAAWKLFKAHKITQSIRNPYSNDSLTFAPIQTRAKRDKSPTHPHDAAGTQDIRRQTPSPNALSPQAIPMALIPSRAPLDPNYPTRKFHLPIGASVSPEYPSPLTIPDTSMGRIDDAYEPGTPTSIGPTFASPSHASSHGSVGAHVYENKEDMEMSDSDAYSSMRILKENDSFVGFKHKVFTEEFPPTGGNALKQRELYFSSKLEPGVSGPPQDFMPAIWRLVFFQVSFFSIEILAALSTIIDITANHGAPTPFGTQHVALLLAAWGPCIVFGHTPAIRRRLAGMLCCGRR